MKIKAIISFSKLSDDEFNTESQTIIVKMTGNVNYPDPTPSIEEVSTARSEYDASLAAAKSGGREQTAIKNQKRKILEDLLGKLGLYVELNCKNDLSILFSSGYKAKKDSEPIGVLDEPSNFRVVNGVNSGTIKLSLDPIKGADVYFYQWAPVPVNGDTIWESELGKTSITIKGLIPGKEYAFRVCGKGAAEEKVFSDIITRFIA